MSKRKLLQNLIFTMLSFCCITSCENDSFHTQEELSETKIRTIIPMEDNDTASVFVNTFSDLKETLSNSIENREDSLFKNGWKKVIETNETRAVQRARLVRTDTVYVYQETMGYSPDPSVYNNFKARFSQSMVDSINRVVRPELRISTSKTYICRWRLYGTYYNAVVGEQVASRSSPLCALVPSTKTSYIERGYSMYSRAYGDKTQYQMDSYQLRIQWENVSHETIILDIDWPFFPKNGSGPGIIGYQFIYVVSKRV